jgi:hypothetical protein
MNIKSTFTLIILKSQQIEVPSYENRVLKSPPMRIGFAFSFAKLTTHGGRHVYISLGHRGEAREKVSLMHCLATT